jgi:ferredoxin
MAYVVTEKCINCKYSDCVAVCPVECFYEGPNLVVIDPEECIDCGLCVPECPIGAIYEQHDLSVEQYVFIEVNAKYSKCWPNISGVQEPMLGAEEWSKRENKIEELIYE